MGYSVAWWDQRPVAAGDWLVGWPPQSDKRRRVGFVDDSACLWDAIEIARAKSVDLGVRVDLLFGGECLESFEYGVGATESEDG